MVCSWVSLSPIWAAYFTGCTWCRVCSPLQLQFIALNATPLSLLITALWRPPSLVSTVDCAICLRVICVHFQIPALWSSMPVPSVISPPPSLRCSPIAPLAPVTVFPSAPSPSPSTSTYYRSQSISCLPFIPCKLSAIAFASSAILTLLCLTD